MAKSTFLFSTLSLGLAKRYQGKRKSAPRLGAGQGLLNLYPTGTGTLIRLLEGFETSSLKFRKPGL